MNQFPKERQPLPYAYQEIYDKHIRENRLGKTKVSFFSSRLEGWLHRQVARSSVSHLKTLEIGAGTLNQLGYENAENYDIVEPFGLLFQDSPLLGRISNIFDDISKIPPEWRYDRIISIATFEHILDLPDMVARSCNLLNPGGGLYVSIPNEGRFLWKLAYKLTTGAEFKRRYGLDYSVLMNYEHCNTADEIEDVLRHFYDHVSVKLFGPCKTFALYRFYCCTKPNLHKAREILHTS